MSPSPAAAGRGRSIEVALTTFNSEAFLAAQLESLFGQTRQDFTLVVSDDGSEDGTIDILAAYDARYPGRMRILPADGKRRGVIGNFGRLLEASEADYVFPCDHDDVWLPRKIEISLAAMAKLEAAHPAGTPLLVHTDLVVTDAELEVLGPSFFEYSGNDARRNDLLQLLLSNVVTGCASVINKALCARARPVPLEAMMYDHWLALVAAATGAIAFVDEPTILYRQHGGNAIGARRPGTASLLQRVYGTLISDERERILTGYSRQAAVLLERFGNAMDRHQRAATETLATLWRTPRLARFARLRRCGLGMRGLIRNTALFIVVTRGRSRAGD